MKPRRPKSYEPQLGASSVALALAAFGLALAALIFG
jgi:hypothetical protein